MKKKFIKRKKEIKKKQKKTICNCLGQNRIQFFRPRLLIISMTVFFFIIIIANDNCVCLCQIFIQINWNHSGIHRTHTESLRNESKNQELILKTTKQQQTNSHWLINKLAEWKYCKRNNPENKNDSFFIAIAQFIVNFEMNQQQQQQKKKTKIYILHLIMSPVVFSIFKDPEPKRNHHYLALKKQRHD